jgi:hypothetical protein
MRQLTPHIRADELCRQHRAGTAGLFQQFPRWRLPQLHDQVLESMTLTLAWNHCNPGQRRIDKVSVGTRLSRFAAPGGQLGDESAGPADGRS